MKCCIVLLFIYFRYYKALLVETQKPHIRQFAAESIAFLIRKLNDQNTFLNILFKSVDDDPSLVEGVGILLFESIKGVNRMLHSCAGSIIPLALQKLGGDILRNDAEIDQVGVTLMFQCIDPSLQAKVWFVAFPHMFCTASFIFHYIC